MTDIVERLRELEAVESELACECDCPPEATANYRYAMTCADAADEIARLRAENESLKTAIQRQANAVRTLEYCKKAEINILRQTHQQAHVAAMTLDSEKNANAILTEENERLRAALEPFACMCSVKGEGVGGLCFKGSCLYWNARAALEETKHE